MMQFNAKILPVSLKFQELCKKTTNATFRPIHFPERQHRLLQYFIHRDIQIPIRPTITMV